MSVCEQPLAEALAEPLMASIFASWVCMAMFTATMLSDCQWRSHHSAEVCAGFLAVSWEATCCMGHCD